MKRLLILVLLFLTACTAITPKPANTELPSFADWQKISMKQTGGIMGLSRSLEVSSSGKFTARDERGGKTVTGDLSAAELSRLNGLITSSKYNLSSLLDDAACADCFVYDISIQSDEKESSSQFNDVNLPNSGKEPLVKWLREFLQQQLQ